VYICAHVYAYVCAHSSLSECAHVHKTLYILAYTPLNLLEKKTYCTVARMQESMVLWTVMSKEARLKTRELLHIVG
jgi:hypothetical protein